MRVVQSSFFLASGLLLSQYFVNEIKILKGERGKLQPHDQVVRRSLQQILHLAHARELEEKSENKIVTAFY